MKAIAEANSLTLDFVREGANHTIYRIGDRQIPVGRHTEIPENTARKMLKQARAATREEQ